MSSEPFRATLRDSIARLACALALAAGCGNAEPPQTEPGAAEGAAVSLVPTFGVAVRQDSVRFRLRVGNDGTSGVELSFPTGQRYDFAVEDSTGAEVWRWSSDRMFTQAMESEVLEPGEVLEYGASWDPAGREGSYRAVARLVSGNRPVELRTEFELGEG